jgi:hypothetical protein
MIGWERGMVIGEGLMAGSSPPYQSPPAVEPEDGICKLSPEYDCLDKLPSFHTYPIKSTTILEGRLL